MTAVFPWEALAASVGAVRKRENQDHVQVHLAPGRDRLSMAVADGHGAASHFRSARGAVLAVEAFLAVADVFGARAVGASLPAVKAEAESRFPRELVRSWQDRVLRDIANHPFHVDRRFEVDHPGKADDSVGGNHRAESDHRDADRQVTDHPSDSRALADRPFEDAPPWRPAAGGTGGDAEGDQDLVPYGSTVIGAVITNRFVLCWQLGDGDVVIVDQDGRPSTPLGRGELDFGDETESLCTKDAWRLVRVHWAPIPVGTEPPALVSLCTDGLSKSFAAPEGFLEFASGVLDRLRAKGTDAVQSDLLSWLTRASSFSGDDSTVAIGWRTGASG